jgi:hypothetical protein
MCAAPNDVVLVDLTDTLGIPVTAVPSRRKRNTEEAETARPTYTAAIVSLTYRFDAMAEASGNRLLFFYLISSA